jgi:dipeptidyl aminopeptidase B
MATPYERLPQDGGDESWETRPPSVRTDPQRPFVYYGNGPFDPPSSDEEDEDVLLEKQNSRSSESSHLSTDEEGGQKRRPASLRWLIISLVTLILLAGPSYIHDVFRVLDTLVYPGLIGVFAARSYTHASYYHLPGVQHITMDHIFNGTFYAQTKDLNWVPEGKVQWFLLRLDRGDE